jgi:hypothetical protein
MDTEIVFSTFDHGEAQLVRSRLESAGIEAQVGDENSAANFGIATGGFHIMVGQAQAADARALIKSEFQKPE